MDALSIGNLRLSRNGNNIAKANREVLANNLIRKKLENKE
jgi:hypothetical protein